MMQCIKIKIRLPSLVRGRLEKKEQSSEEYVNFYWKFEHTKVTEDKIKRKEGGRSFEEVNMWFTIQEDTDNSSEEAEDDDSQEVSYTAPEEGSVSEDESVSVEERVTNREDVPKEESVADEECVTEEECVNKVQLATEKRSVADEEDNCRGWYTNEGSYSPKKAEVIYMRRFSNEPNREKRSQGPNRNFSFPPYPRKPPTTHFSSPSSLSLSSFIPSHSSPYSDSSPYSYSSPSSYSSSSPYYSSSSYSSPSSYSSSSSYSPSSSTLSSLV